MKRTPWSSNGGFLFSLKLQKPFNKNEVKPPDIREHGWERIDGTPLDIRRKKTNQSTEATKTDTPQYLKNDTVD